MSYATWTTTGYRSAVRALGAGLLLATVAALSACSGGSHNCWLASNAVCGDILTTWITNWAGELVQSSGRKIELEPPVARDPGQSRNFPQSNAAFAGTVYPVLSQFCSQCHSSGSAVK